MPVHAACLFLAAGMSQRFEATDSKLLQIYKGKPLLTYGLKAVQEAKNIQEIIAVIGHQKKKICNAIQENSAAKIAYNSEYQSGIYSSLLCGIRHMSHHINHMLILPADMPNVTASIIDEIIATAMESDEPRPLAYLPVNSENIHGNPVLLDKRILPQLLHYKHQAMDKGAIDFILNLQKKNSDMVRLIPIQSKAIFQDIDNKKDFDRLINSC